MTKRIHSLLKTKQNKIKACLKELKRNPNNTSAKNSLEFWYKNDRRK